MLHHFRKLRQNAIRFRQEMGQKKSQKITESLSKKGKFFSKIQTHADMTFLIMVLVRHLVMYWTPENKSFKGALEVL